MNLKRNRLREFISDERGSSAPLEFVLLSLPLIIVVFTVIQFMLLAHASVVIRSAAHAAARSALVNDCPPASVFGTLDNLASTIAGTLLGSCTPREEEWETAAKLALMPIAPSSEKSKARQNGNCNYPEALIDFMQQDAVRNTLRETLEHKACYTFEPDNVAVEVEWQTFIGGLSITEGMPPIKATVQFKVPLLAPTRKIFSSGERSDGTFYWQGEAEVTIL